MLSCVQIFVIPWTVTSPGSSVCGILQAGSTRVGSCFLFQGIFLPQGLKPSLPHYRQILHPLNHQGSPDNNQFDLYRVSLVPSMFWWPIYSSDRKTFCKNSLFTGCPPGMGNHPQGSRASHQRGSRSFAEHVAPTPEAGAAHPAGLAAHWRGLRGFAEALHPHGRGAES